MKTGCFGILLALASVLPAWAQVAVPPSFNYQGVLRDGIGGILTNHTPTVQFRLYSASSGSTALWSGSQKVLLDSNGLFNVTLSDGMAGSMGGVTLGGVMASNQNLFIGITVDDNSEIAPRQQLLSVPFALKAGDANQASTGFTIRGGSLTAYDGASVLGLLEASSIQIGTNTLVADGANGDLKLNGNLEISEQLHVKQNITVDGATKLSGSTTLNGNTTVSNINVKGPVSILATAREFPEQKLAAGVYTCFAGVPSDGFITLNFEFNYKVGDGNEDNHFTSTLLFTNSASAISRSMPYYFHTYDLDGGSGYIYKRDIITLPIAKGEALKVNVTTLNTHDGGFVNLRALYFPFGVSQ